ncbi:hypothetical protein T09_10688, partial [Trichinella sp. T9]
LIKPQVVLSCSFVHAAVPTFQMVVGPQGHIMNVPKRNFCGRKPLLLEILEQGFHLTRRPNIYDFETRSRPTCRSTAWQKWKKQPCTWVLGKLP